MACDHEHCPSSVVSTRPCEKSTLLSRYVYCVIVAFVDGYYL